MEEMNKEEYYNNFIDNEIEPIMEECVRYTIESEKKFVKKINYNEKRGHDYEINQLINDGGGNHYHIENKGNKNH